MPRLTITRARDLLNLGGAANKADYDAIAAAILVTCIAKGYPVWKESITQAQWNDLIATVRALPAMAAVGPATHQENPRI